MQLNPVYADLPSYPFPRLRVLLKDVNPPPGEVFDLTLGAPRHGPPPAFVQNALNAHFDEFSRYPPIAGSEALKSAICGYLKRRYGACLDASQVLPLVGTREGLYMLAQLMVRPGRGKVLLPNPFYPAYAAAGLTMGAQPVYLDTHAASGFLPDLNALTPDILQQTALFFLCSPSNPQGAAAPKEYLEQALNLARDFDFLLAVDECYADIYTRAAPIGALEAAAGDMSNLVVIHSLSKRSNAPGLRSGFIGGDVSVISGFEKLRSYGGPTMPLPVQAASSLCWSDDAHVAANRSLYDAKFTSAEKHLGVTRPDGGFFLWLPVHNPVETAKRLWAEAGVKVLPGSYLASESQTGQNPGEGFIRVALVDLPEKTDAALQRLATAL